MRRIGESGSHAQECLCGQKKCGVEPPELRLVGKAIRPGAQSRSQSTRVLRSAVMRVAERIDTSLVMRALCEITIGISHAAGDELSDQDKYSVDVISVACARSMCLRSKGRKLLVDLEKEQELARQLAVEWDQLQLEQRTWATHATGRKDSRKPAATCECPDASRIQTITDCPTRPCLLLPGISRTMTSRLHPVSSCPPDVPGC